MIIKSDNAERVVPSPGYPSVFQLLTMGRESVAQLLKQQGHYPHRVRTRAGRGRGRGRTGPTPTPRVEGQEVPLSSIMICDGLQIMYL